MLRAWTLAGEDLGWLATYDVDAHEGRGTAAFTFDLTRAATFETTREALDVWRAQSKRRPLRPDGRPNRPLTTFTMEVTTLDRLMAGGGQG